MKRRILSIITALALCLSLCPTWAFATEADPSLCKHHPEHTEDCGYIAPTEGHDCGHQHTAECYTLGVLPDADGGDPYEVGADTENLLNCQHSHDSECGYVEADPGAPCGYVCHICPIEDLIAALPEQVTEDNADDVRARLDEILDLYRELNEDEQGQLDLSRVTALQEALDAANDPDMIEGEVSVTYQEAAWNGSEVTYTGKTENCTSVESSTEAVTWNAGWYVVNSTVTISEPITVTGAVNLILADGCTLNAKKGIVVTTGNSLTIYAQSGGTGTLNATGTADSSNNASAGIGGSTSSFDSGAITIHGGVINATGGSAGSISYGGAGIGGGTPGYGNGGSSGAITIYGGTVTANSGAGDATGAGIGGGGGLTGGGAGNNIQIYGGTVNATGGEGGAGIGGGSSGSSSDSSYKSGDGAVTISGGTVTAVGGTNAAGIGGGGGYYFSSSYGSSGCTGGTGSVTISGGIVDAKGGDGNSSGDYAGAPIGNGGNAGDTTATVSKTNAIVFENGAGTVCGDVTLDGSYTVPGDYTLNIPLGASLSGSGTLSGGSAFTTENLTVDMISVPSNLYYDGKDRTEYLTTELSAELTRGVTICGQTFTVSGWTVTVVKAADNDLTYTATYTNNDNTNTFTKTITLQKSGTDLTEGKVQTYNGETLTKDFTASDTIKVVATPTPTGAVPTNSAMFAASFTEPGAGQMAVFVGDTQVSVPADKGEDGSYTMTVSAADVLLAAGGPDAEITLTAKFVGNDNMADGTGTATVNITAVAVAEKDGKVIGYYGESNLDDAFTNDSATVTLLANVERTNTLTIKVNCTLDLGGHNITFTGTENVWVQGLVTAMTIRGEGEIISEQGHALVVTGSVTLEGGTFTSNGENCAGVYVNSAGASLSVTGEYVTIRNTGGGYGLAVNYAQSVQLSAGTYKGEKAVSIVSGTTTLGDLLDGGCAYHSGDTPIALEAGGKELTGTVTVKACTHTGEGVCTYAHNENTSTHTKTCLACGQTWDAEDCDYGEYTHNDTSHTRICKLCGYQNVEEHNIKCTAEASGTVIAVSEACKTCGYGKDLGTVTIHIPKLVYGDLTGVVTAETTLTETVVVAVRVDNNPSGSTTIFPLEPPTMATLTGNALLSAGTHQIKIEIIICRNDNYLADCMLPFTVDPAPLTPSITGTAAKTYDGTTDVAAGQLSITLTGVVTDDDVTAAATSYAYDNANAGENKTITASGITLEGDSKDNYTLSSTTATTTGTITKSQPTIAFAGGYDPSKTYDGQTIPNPTADDLTITGAAFGNVDFTWYAGNVDEANKLANPPKDAGTYTLTAAIPETTNTEAAEAVLTVTISPKAVTPTITITPDSYKYTGSAIHPSGSAVKVMDGDTVIPDSEYTLSYGENTQVGQGSVTVTDKENGNYTITQTTETFTITAKPLTGAKVEVTGTFTYTGNALTPAPTVTLDGKTLTAGTDYTVAYDKNTDAGAAKITVTGKGNYSGTAQGTFTIGRATLTADGTGTASGTYGDKLSELTVSGLTAKLGEATVTGTWKLAGGTVPNVGDSGEYTATFTPATGADNYNALTAKVTLNIAKADYSGTTTASTSAKFSATGTYDLSALLPDGATAGTAATTSDIFEGTPEASGKTLTYTLKAGAAPNNTGTITVPVTSTNYNGFNLTITVTVTDKDVPTLTVSPITVTYTGEAIPGTAIKGTAKVGSTTVPGTWSFKDAAPAAVADSGVKTVLFTPTDGTNYAAVEATVMVTISKATPTGAPKYTAISASGKTLADAGLTTEGGTFSTTGTVAWALGTDTAVTANTQYEWTFTPTDTANYNTLTGKITLWVQSTGGGSYVPSGPSSPGTSTLPVTTTGQGSTTTTTAAPTASTQGGTAATTISTTMGQEIVKQAVANNSETVVIAPKVTGSVTKAEVSIPASTVGQIGSQTNASLTVSTPVANVTIPNGGLGSLGSAGGTVTVTAEQTGNSVELTVTAGGQTVQNVPGGMTLTVPAASTTPGTVAVLVHPDGTREVVRKSVADNGAVTIPLDGSAKLEIVDNSGHFADVPATSWAADAVAFASSHELFNGTAPGQFSPNVPMSRGMLAVVLHNLESNPAQALTGAFADVDNSQWYAEGVAWAEAQGIIGGYGNGRFGPNDNITREQLAVMLWRYAGSPAATDRELHFADAHRASNWALEALRWATENGIINGKGGGILDPTGQATRAETAQMLKNFMESK